jgi:hypothetical protein
MSLLFLLPPPDTSSLNNVLQPLFTLGLAGLAVGALTLGAGFALGYLVYMNATKDRSSDHH